MILIDAGPLVALFNPNDASHADARSRFAQLGSDIATTLPVLTEAFHLLNRRASRAGLLVQFLRRGGMPVRQPGDEEVDRALALMIQYADLPMDFADASLIAAAEAIGTRRIFTLDHRDFSTYRVRRGHRHDPVEIV